MHSVLQIALVGALTAALCVVLKSLRPEFAFAAGAAGSILLFMLALPALRDAMEGIRQISAAGKIGESAEICLKAALIALLCEFVASICRDAGENALAGRIEFCARTFLCAMCVPVMSSLVSSLGSLSFFS